MFLSLKEDNLEELLSELKKSTIVMIGADWCSDCHDAYPKFKKISDENKDIPFIYVDADKFPNSRDLVEFTHIPTFVAFKLLSNNGQKSGSDDDTIKEVLSYLK